MKEDVKNFLDSGLLEEYLMGTCSEQDKVKAEYYIENFPEARKEYDDLQEKIEKMSHMLAVDSPKGLKEAIISCLEDESDYKVKSNVSKKRNLVPQFIPWAAALIGIVASIALFLQKQDLEMINMQVHAEKNMTESQLEATQLELELVKEKLAISGHNKTERVLLAGNNLSPEFQTTAFWNDVAGKAILYINELGDLDESHCYQVWADVDGKMINAGIIPDKKGAYELNYLRNASSLNITIEPKGGSDHPNVSKIVCSKELIKI